MLYKAGCICFVSVLLFSACGPGKDHRTSFQKTGTYPIKGSFREPIASVVIERNGRFDVAASMGSSFLVEPKERGVFATARHVISMDVEYRVYFCGKVYRARRILDPGVTDVGFLKIVSSFNSADFPDPYTVGDIPQPGDELFVRGIHMHRESLQKGKVLHRIIEMYYGITEVEMVDGRLEKKEFVYDNLPARVSNEDALTFFMKKPDIDPETIDYIVKNHPTMMETKDDHQISFGGLSGGPTVNTRGEVVGINVVQSGNDEGVYELDENGLKYNPRVTMAFLGSDDLKRALEGLRLRP